MMESEKEVKELEEILKDAPFVPIESPLKRWWRKIKNENNI